MHELSLNLIGWFAIAFSKELQPGQQKSGWLANHSYLLSRDEHGKLEFNGNEDNILEQNDIIFVWHHPNKLPPNWHLPRLDDMEWSRFHHHRLIAYTHPQEVYENCVDVAHFPKVHGFHDMAMVEAPIFSEQNMVVKHRIRRRTINPFSKKLISAYFEVCLHGIGCAYNHIEVPSLGIKVRMFALTTPTHQNQVEIRLSVAVAISKQHLLKKMFLPLILKTIQKNIIHDFCQDIFIWENKCYRAAPLLVKGEGQIVKFRQWCSQFYT